MSAKFNYDDFKKSLRQKIRAPRTQAQPQPQRGLRAGLLSQARPLTGIPKKLTPPELK
jgi:hypothetical protein